ncbi:8-amino-7-oxononanoate synthase [uncultured Chryseobacterium sp.]|uniref:8-amino-7-oxononanoate synthase n=1 Tax=uncultured Chryseobacterium sp. TaxID=259322 RepID=UPI0025CFB1B1|nr:8-amino-7-oxononanoate synthase [uncultured Chryseobacterium sp.]
MLRQLKIYRKAAELPESWNSTAGTQNILLTREYLSALEDSVPDNMDCFFAGFFLNGELIGGALFQYLDFRQHSTFRKDEVSYGIRNFLIRKVSRNIMILGNNMLTGQNGFHFDLSRISFDEAVSWLSEAAQKIQKEAGRTSIIIFKDYKPDFAAFFKQDIYRHYHHFSVQPNMILHLRPEWCSFGDYLNDLSKKYRGRAKTAKKKLEGIRAEELDLQQVRNLRTRMNELYLHVAENAPFNTFFLADNHFESMKEHLEDNFRILGYFSGNELIGFCTLILNHADIDTYFLGYDKGLQKSRQLYLNMLLDMVEFGIRQRCKRIIFGRTALEIKSTIGAVPVEIVGLIRHNHPVINLFMKNVFSSVSPKMEWIQRSPFKDD